MESPGLPNPSYVFPERSFTCLIIRYSHIYGPLIIVLTFCLLTWTTWGKWQDILIDFGRELYVPWRLTQGEVLYRDLAYLNGPLSPYLNALFFRLFGVSYSTLILSNLIILLLMTWLIYSIARQITNNLLSTITCIVFLTIFGFGHIVGIGNYNFITPYSHEMTHGLFFSFTIFYLFTLLFKKIFYAYIIIISILLGLISLGKGEIFAAALITVVVGIFLTFFIHQCSWKKIIICISLMIIFILTPIIMALGLLSFKMPLEEALKGIAGTWAGLLGSQVSSNFFYLHCMGIDQPGQNLLRMVVQFVGVVLLITALVVIDLFRREKKKFFWLGISGLLLLSVIIIKKPLIPWILTGPPLPLFSLTFFLTTFALCLRKRFDHTFCQRFAPLAL